MSTDTKTSPVVVKRPAKYEALPNAFGLTEGAAASCGGATAACEAVCYVAGTKRYAAVGALLSRNWDAVREWATADGYEALRDAFVVMLRESLRKQTAKGVAAPLFRWQWAGDVANGWHARAIAEACAEVPQIAAWLYTRSLFAVPALVGVANLRVIISADVDNVRAAEAMGTLYPSLQIAYLQGTPTTRTRRALVCPAATRGNVVPSRKSPSGLSGICAVCRACVDGKATPDIVFPVH